MTGLMRVIATVLAVAGMAIPAAGQTETAKSAPDVTLVHKGASKALEDLEKILMLTNERQQKQWKVINQNLQVFLIGIDRSQPLRIDLLFRENGKLNYRPAFPVSDIKQFRNENLKPFGIDTRRYSASLYKCKGNVFEGYMRHKHGYAVFSEQRSDLPLNMPNPVSKIKDLIATYDMAVQGANSQTDAQSTMARRTWFQTQRKELLSLVKKQSGETETDYELRRLLMQQQLNEMERFYAESAGLTIGWKTDLSAMEGHGELTLTPIPGTSLEKSLKLLATTPSRFAGIPRRDDSTLSLRVNWPLDEMRKAHLLELFKAVRNREVAGYEAGTALSDKQKAASTKMADLILKLLSTNVSQGLFDGFAEVQGTDDNKTAVGGFKTADGTIVTDILNLLPQTRAGRTVMMDVDKVGDIRIHKVGLNLSEESMLKTFIGKGEIYIGNSKGSVWLASGEGALENLKTAIQKADEPPPTKPNPVFFDFFIRVGSWLDVISRAVDKADISSAAKKPAVKNNGNNGTSANGNGDKNDGLTANEKEELRKLAKEAFAPGKDGIHMQLRRDDDHVTGSMHVQTDVLRFVGAMMAKFSEETLDDSTENSRKKTRLKR